MSVVSPPRLFPTPHFENGAEWHRALGNVPLHRIIFNPPPGTATEADLLRFVEGDKLCELVDGTLVEKPPGYIESLIAARLGTKLTNWADATNAGFVSGADGTLRMLKGNIRLPDVSFISIAQFPGGIVPRKAVPSISPDLAVEVLSESNTVAEIDRKLREYFESGTRLALVIDPADRSTAVYRNAVKPDAVLGESDLFEDAGVLPGFSLRLSDLFRNLPPSE